MHAWVTTGKRTFDYDVNDYIQPISTGTSAEQKVVSPILGRNESSEPLPIQGDTVALQEAPEPVKKEATRVNRLLFAVLFVLGIIPAVCYVIGVLIYAHFKDSEQDLSEHEALNISVIPPFPTRDLYTIPEAPADIINYHKESLLKETKKLQQAEMQTLRNQQEQLLKEATAVGPGKGYEEGCVELVSKLKKLKTDLKKLASEWDVRKGLIELFIAQSNSAEGLPFTIYFKGEELSQKPRDAEMVDGANNQFNIAINKKLMDWAGIESMDPLGKSIIAQSLLVELAQLIHEPLYIDWNEYNYSPSTLPSGGAQVFFESNQRIIIARQMQTIDHDIYAWIEEYHYSDVIFPRFCRHI